MMLYLTHRAWKKRFTLNFRRVIGAIPYTCLLARNPNACGSGYFLIVNAFFKAEKTTLVELPLHLIKP